MKRHYYHLTNKAWPNIIKLQPRSEGENRGYNEPDCERICVAPSIEQCLVAIIPSGFTWKIYRTYHPVETRETVKPARDEVLDAHITGERWLVKPRTFIRLGYVRKAVQDISTTFFGNWGALGDGEGYSEAWQRETIKKLKKMEVLTKRR